MNAINEISNQYRLSIGKISPLASLWGPLAKTKKNLRNYGESGCGWLY